MSNQEEKELVGDIVKLHLKIFGEKMTKHFLVEGKKIIDMNLIIRFFL